MGKKPVVAIVGLIWAGMALVGCENCKNCRNRNTAPTYTPTGGAPVVRQDAPASPSVGTPTAGAGKAAFTKAADPVGTQGFDKSPVGIPTSTGATPAPTNQTSLSSPGPDARPVGLPGQDAAYRSGEMPISKSVPSDGSFRMPPPRPVSPVSASMPIGTTDPAPKNTTPSAAPTLPPMPAGLSPAGLTSPSMPAPPVAGALPNPPTTPAPMPVGDAMPIPLGSGNAMPSVPPSK